MSLWVLISFLMKITWIIKVLREKKPFVLVHLSKLLTLNDHLFKTKYIKWHIACISRLSHFKVACFVEKRSFSIDCLVCFYLKLSLQLDYHFKRYPNIKNISFNWYCNQPKQNTFITCALWIDACNLTVSLVV